VHETHEALQAEKNSAAAGGAPGPQMVQETVSGPQIRDAIMQQQNKDAA